MEQQILSALVGKELYGLEIFDALSSEGWPPLSLGSIYPALNRLEKRGQILSRWGDVQEGSGGARRKYYRLTSQNDQ